MATSIVPVPPGLCRCCVRTLSRRVRAVPGVVSFTVDAQRAVVVVEGEPDPAELSGALAPLGAPGTA